MPTTVPKRLTYCLEGHRMFFMSVPMLNYDFMTVIGCEGPGCPANSVERVKDFCYAEGLMQKREREDLKLDAWREEVKALADRKLAAYEDEQRDNMTD